MVLLQTTSDQAEFASGVRISLIPRKKVAMYGFQKQLKLLKAATAATDKQTQKDIDDVLKILSAELTTMV